MFEILKKPILLNIAINISVTYSMYFIFKEYFIFRYNIDNKMYHLFLGYFSEIIGVLMIILHLFFIILYKLEIPFFEKMKANDLKWPWKEDPIAFKKKLYKTIKLYVFNQLLLVPLVLVILSFFLKLRMDLESLPSFYEFIIQLYMCTFIEDFFFYFSHRTLHHPFLYSKIHKIHHSHYNIIYISFAYAHPIEFILGNIMPTMYAAFILGNYMHFMTLSAFILFRTLESMETHSGYEFTFSMFQIIPFSTNSAYHNFHHLKNIGNYSSFFLTWDTFFGTNKYFYDQSLKHKIE